MVWPSSHINKYLHLGLTFWVGSLTRGPQGGPVVDQWSPGGEYSVLVTRSENNGCLWYKDSFLI